MVENERQIVGSDCQFAVTLSDERYAVVVERGRMRHQPSYNLSRRNCIHFVAEIAEAAGPQVDYPRRLMRRPRSYLQHMRVLVPQSAAPATEAAAPPG